MICGKPRTPVPWTGPEESTGWNYYADMSVGQSTGDIGGMHYSLLSVVMHCEPCMVSRKHRHQDEDSDQRKIEVFFR